MVGHGKQSFFRRLVEAGFSSEELERIKSLPTRQNEYGYDPFGFNREEAKLAVLVVRWFYRSYFRCKVYGIEHVPAGRVMLVANHSGQLPFDGMNIGAAMLFDATPARLTRAMIERYVPSMPYVSYLFSRWGQIVGSPENCERLLRDEECILVFPEGVKGISKPFTQRYQLQEFGLGFMRLALATGTPIVPVAVVGGEEQAPAFNLRPLAKLLGAPAFPVMPFPPFFPLLPLPSRYHIHFGEPRSFIGHPDDDDEQIEQLVKTVRLSIESMLRVGLKERRSVFF
jgi:1-acyl-sn-glycerol-3-phosphate acyltransferase